jgi:hypothetical protein
MSKFISLVGDLKGWFDKPLTDLPTAKRQRVERDFPFAFLWDKLKAFQRQSGAEQWDYQNDPALEEQRMIDWDEAVVDWAYWNSVPLLTAEEFSILRHVFDPRDFAAERATIPGGEGRTLGERVSDDVRIIERAVADNNMKPIEEWVSWAQQQGWEIPAYLRAPADAGGDADRIKGAKPVASSKIKAAFAIPRENNNDSWWDTRMRDAKDYGLIDSRAAPGRGSRPSLWYPDRIAGWLLDKKHFQSKQIAGILRRSFPDCADYADVIDPPGDG